MTLQSLLDDGRRFDAEYAGGLANHLPMALLALHRLGAGELRLQEFAATYASRLAPARAAVSWPGGDAWRSRLGDADAWPAYRHLFAQWLDNEGAGAVLNQALPPLMAGCGAAAFHGLIRTAYAVQAAQRGELADALAYWACRWLDLGAADAGGRKSSAAARKAGSVADVSVLLAQLPVLKDPEAAGRLIVDGMQAASRLPGFLPTVARLRVGDDTLALLARAAARLYAASGDFTVLHLVTSAHAMRRLMPFIEDPAPSLSAYWRAFAAGCTSTGIDLLAATTPPPLQPWSALVAHALASSDEHAIKLVDSCREEEKAYGGDDWRVAASRLLWAAEEGG